MFIGKSGSVFLEARSSFLSKQSSRFEGKTSHRILSIPQTFVYLRWLVNFKSQIRGYFTKKEKNLCSKLFSGNILL